MGGHFSCSNNHLTSLEGAPEEVRGHFACSDNKLTSLEGAPKVLRGFFFTAHTINSLIRWYRIFK